MNFWCEIDKNIIRDNVLKIKERTNKKLISVVKANAYGLGINEIVDILKDETDMFGVSTLEEASVIPSNKDVLIMTPICDIPTVPKDNEIYTIDSLDNLNYFSSEYKYRVHIYVDSGMNRLGISEKDLDGLIIDIYTLYPNVKIEGIYTHLHNSKNIQKTKKQILMLYRIYEKYKSKIKWFHCLNSNGVLNDELLKVASFTNMVRTGNIIYGFAGNSKGFKRAFKIKANITKIYTIKDDCHIGYGSKSKVKKGTIVGVIPIGTIDKIGLKKDTSSDLILNIARLIKNSIHKRCYITLNGQKLHTLCEPNMNCTLIDLSNVDLTQSLIVDIHLSPIQSDSSILKDYF